MRAQQTKTIAETGDHMNKIDFGTMSRGKRALYECMWGSKDFDLPVEKTVFKGSPSNNSYTFADTSAANADICRNRLAELFGIKHHGLFKEKFSQSCGGDGQEWKRIATLHSSALCALLFFYHVSEENPYMMEIAGKKYILWLSL